ncbi:cytochrome P450 [Streptomyces sp. DSM 44915]|uniref:Cytochrome P450 n=1 Tax=Streptomyces chisholmiae TaxID=3075540 RepID=A0ABU2JUU7_9ACTN|nr:cytochrome P450 [Streptomyces sp. DSM 44915]MDT0268742.1 cytochrome P450 [Streptomyces sp. DSM 44915]
MSPDAQHAADIAELPYPFAPPEGLEVHPRYRQLQADTPVCPVRMPYGDPAVLVTRYEDTRTVLGDSRFSRATPPGNDQPRTTPDELPLGIMAMDPPEHTRMRRLLSATFSPRRAERQRPATEALAGRLLDRMVETGPPADLVTDYASPLAMGVICDLLGVPIKDREDFHRWAVAVAGGLGGEGVEERMESIATLATYMAELIAQRRETPTDDLIGELTHTADQGERLSEGELIHLCMLLLVAGYETAASQLGHCVHLLCTHPDQLALLRERPELLPAAVEELLRFTPLAVSGGYPRFATRDVDLGEGRVPEGTAVLTLVGVANRDPRVFDDPDRLDITRQHNPHLAFGHGPHHCVGAALGRMQLRTALRLLLERLPDLRLATDPGELTWKPNLLLRAHTKLPVAW